MRTSHRDRLDSSPVCGILLAESDGLFGSPGVPGSEVGAGLTGSGVDVGSVGPGVGVGSPVPGAGVGSPVPGVGVGAKVGVEVGVGVGVGVEDGTGVGVLASFVLVKEAVAAPFAVIVPEAPVEAVV